MSAVIRAAAAVTPAATLIVRQAVNSTSMDKTASQASASEAIKSLSSNISQASQSLSQESQIASGHAGLPSWMKGLGIGLAVGSGVLIGASFVFKKKGLLAAQRKYNTKAGESYAYLKSPMWWTGMIMMILGEVLNLIAYAVSSAIVVTPMGALSVVISAILSSIFLKEKLTLFGKIGCFLCIVGSTVIAINAPSQHAAGDIQEFRKMFLAVGFLVWGSVCIVASLILAFFVAPRFGKKHMLVYISICSLIGGLSVSCISGVGSAIILSIQGDNQFKHWFLYFLLVFVTVTLVTEIIYLNKALELFNTAMVTPTYYVLFTFATLVSSIILFQGLDSTPIQIVTIVLGFLTICAGITLLQISKIDPEELTENGAVGLDRDTTLLIRASRSMVGPHEKGMATGVEDPGMDSVRGGLGVIGSIVRARSSRRIASSSADSYNRMAEAAGPSMSHGHNLNTLGKHDLERYELHDRPMPSSPHLALPFGMPQKRDTAISFASGSDGPHGHHADHRPSQLQHEMRIDTDSDLGIGTSSGGILRSPTHQHQQPNVDSAHLQHSLDSVIQSTHGGNDGSRDAATYNRGIRIVGRPRKASASTTTQDVRHMYHSSRPSDFSLPSYVTTDGEPMPMYLDEAKEGEDYDEKYDIDVLESGHTRSASSNDSSRSTSPDDQKKWQGSQPRGGKPGRKGRDKYQLPHIKLHKDNTTRHAQQSSGDVTNDGYHDESEELLSPVMRDAQTFVESGSHEQGGSGTQCRQQSRKGASVLSPRFQKNIKNFK